MWLFNAPPIEPLRVKYHFELTSAWLEQLQKSAVHFPNGSGAFVSAEGLIITNQHIAEGALQKASSAKQDLLKAGFYAKTRAEELKCPGLSVDILISIENVTAQINAAIKPGMSIEESLAARKTTISAIEKGSFDKTGLRSTVTTLYQGSEYHLYRYKRFTDLRLVFAPEQQAAMFGGDPDNFEFPRYDLDLAFLRAYENGQPAKVDHFLKIGFQGTHENELVFVAGHPGRTNRSLTVAELEYLRDVHIPRSIAYLNLNETLMTAWSARSSENTRKAQDELLTVQNARKLHYGRYEALLTPELFARKKKEESTLQEFARTHSDLNDAVPAWEEIAKAQRTLAKQYASLYAVELYISNVTTIKLARYILRAVAEKQKPSGERMREFRDSNLPNIEQAILADVPLDRDFEELKLAIYFLNLVQEFGVDHPLCTATLAGKSPSKRAFELIEQSKFGDSAFRKRVYAMPPGEFAQLDDPILTLLRGIDEEGRNLRKNTERQNEIKEQAYAKIAKVRYAKDGVASAPDASSTLRLCFGTTKGYEEGGHAIEAFTTVAGLYARSAEHKSREPFDLPPSWSTAKDKLDPHVPLNFVSTCDIVGGNSGSPIVNKEGALVGVVFDQNLPSLIGDYIYSDTQARAISVGIRGIVAALRTVYRADELLKELTGTPHADQPEKQGGT